MGIWAQALLRAREEDGARPTGVSLWDGPGPSLRWGASPGHGLGACTGPLPLQAPAECMPAFARWFGFTVAVGKDKPRVYFAKREHSGYCLWGEGGFR